MEDQENRDKLQSAADAQAEMIRDFVHFFFVIAVAVYTFIESKGMYHQRKFG